jgi:serine/threonine-protein kinase
MAAENSHADEREQLLDEVLTGYLRAVDAGHSPDRTELLGRHPDLAPDIERFLAAQESFARWTEPVRQLHQTPLPDGTPADGSLCLGSFGEYELLGPIARGGMGTVFKARQRGVSRVVALKVIRAGGAASADDVRRFRNEVETVAHLDHPGVVPIYDAGEENGALYFSMKLYDAGSLADRLDRFAADPRAAARLVAELARSIHHAHQRGVLHRDLKPSNVLLDEDGRPVVADFGLARRLDADGDLTQSGALLGTPNYVAPELVAGAKGATTAADTYGLGAVLYALLTGRPPFRGETVLETLEQVKARDPDPPRRLNPRVDRDLETICLKCLQKDPRRRFASADELADDLDRYLRGEPVRARPIGVAARTWKWARRHPGVAALAGVSCASALTLAVVVAVYTVRLREAVSQADANAAEAKRRQVEATRNYHAARDALHRIVGRVRDHQGPDVPRLKELRKAILEDALAFYEATLAGQDEPDPEVRLDAALARAEVGGIEAELGHDDAARASLTRAVELLDSLPAEQRNGPDCRKALSHCYNHLADLAGRAGRDAEAEDFFRKSLAECEALARGDPANPDWQDSVAQCELNLGSFYQTRGRNEAALERYDRTIAIGTPLVAQHPQAEPYRAHLALALMNWGLISAGKGQVGPAADAYRRAEELLRPLVDAHPRNDDYRLPLIAVYVNWGNLLRELGDPAGALAKCDRAVELADAAVAQEPQFRAARQHAFSAHGARALALSDLGRHAEALTEMDRVVELSDDRSRTGNRAIRAAVAARAGQHARAAAEAAEVAGQPGVSGDVLYNLACAYALAVGPAESDPALGPLAGVTAGQGYAAAAVRLLRRLQAEGYFRPPEAARLLTEDPDLASVRGRSDFQALQTEIAGSKKP